MTPQSGRNALLGGGWTGRLLFLILLLYIGRPLLVPLLFGFFLAVILYPLCKKLEMAGLRRGLAIFLGLLAVLLVFSGLILVLLYQYNLFKKDLPLLIERLEPHIQSMTRWLSERTGLTFEGRHALTKNLLNVTGANMGQLIRMGISGTFSAAVNLLVIPVYAALILSYRHTLVRFLLSLTGSEHAGQLAHVLTQTIHVYSNYIKGMVIVYLVVGVLNSIGLLALGVKYAVLFGMVTAFMTIIPYFGIIISSLLPISMAWLSTNSIYYPLGVVLVFSVVQYLEANIIFPYVVGKKVNVNVLVSLVSVFAGGFLWGVSGMVLILPLVAILKIVADESEQLKPLSILLADK